MYEWAKRLSEFDLGVPGIGLVVMYDAFCAVYDIRQYTYTSLLILVGTGRSSISL